MNSLTFFKDSNNSLAKILDHASYEIFVLDQHRNIVYVNNKCEQHYGLKASDIVGKNNSIFVRNGYWSPSIVDSVFEQKQPVTILQTTYIGSELLTTAVPILDHQTKEIELIVITAQELQTFKTVHSKANVINIVESQHNLAKIVTNNSKMKSLLVLLEKIARVDSTVHLYGETGTGKGLIAKRIHQLSPRRNNPMLTINCTAIPENLLESELFGYAPGAFTGAEKSGKIGLIQSANYGTVFLDEIGEISLQMQTKLLHLIQEQQFIPIGGREVVEVDVRFITATNQDLRKLVEEKKFREDLFYRLNVIDITIPPLRERTEDIIPLSYYFLNKFNKKYHFNKTISEQTLNLIVNYSWPGNIRELQNIIERAVVISDSVIQPDDLSKYVQKQNLLLSKDAHPTVENLDQALERLERKIILDTYRQYPSTRQVAKQLNISQTRASNLIRKHRSYSENIE